MFRTAIIAMAAAAVVAGLPPAWAAPSPAAQREIDQLLGYLEKSGCDFQRSGQWYNARAARDHIETKYKYLLQRDMVQTTEGFIADAATSSSMGGGAYMVRCSGVIQPSGDWLRAELARLRKQGAAAPK
jgi:hypothetical protein